MTITFVGHGYVGLVTASIFADLGNTVWVIGHTKEKIEKLQKGIIPIYEPGLKEMVGRNVKAGRLKFTLDYARAIPSSEIVFTAVGTPPKENGEADLSVVLEVAEKIGNNLGDKFTVIATKSTVPVGTNRKIKKIIAKASKNKSFALASVPEFLREGQAISDTLHPDRIVIGTEGKKEQELLIKLHKPIDGKLVLTNIETAEMIKYAANAFLAVKISFANAIAALSEKIGSDGPKVLKAIGLDKRIGSDFLNCGVGYGGSCFPKDVKALIEISRNSGYDFNLLKEVENINIQAKMSIVEKAKKLLGADLKGKKIGILGLSFKPDTDDMRDAPSIVVIKSLQNMGVQIKAFDPIAIDKAKNIFNNVIFCANAYDAAKNVDLLIIMTEWNEFKDLDLQKVKKLMKSPKMIDGRNIYEPQQMKSLGFTYVGVGR